MWTVRFAFVASSMALVCFIGCKGTRLTTYPVSGSIQFEDGQPVSHGTVEFRLQDGFCARGSLDASGRFALGSFSEMDGAPAGEYRVVIVQYFNFPPRTAPASGNNGKLDHASHASGADIRVATDYSDYAKTDLRAVVLPKKDTKFDFIVKRLRQQTFQR